MIALRGFLFAAAGGLATLSVPALADVKAGVDAWGRGDYDSAVAEWRDPAAAGDADAQFNMAQAYRLGRGVEADPRQAEIFYKRAAAQGHIQAADNYGLLLFQDGRREEAMPYVQAAAERGDPRAQYLLGIAHFNGDLVAKDWVRAYAMLTMANSAGLPQAAPALVQMDSFIPLGQRQDAQELAARLKREADAKRSSQMAAADLTVGQADQVGGAKAAPRMAQTISPPAAQTVAPQVAASVAVPDEGLIPQPIPSTPVAPSVAAAQAAVAEASRVTGTSSPATAGADFARPAATDSPSGPPAGAATPAPRSPRAQAAARPSASTTLSTIPAMIAPSIAPAQASAQPSADGPWRVQLGAFSVNGSAERLWSRLSGNAVLSGKQRFLVPAGRLTKLQAGGFASRGAAQGACNLIKRSGQACIVTR